jgi:hypothetical protein
MSTERLCPECLEPVEGRRLRHPGCRKAQHARDMRERRAAEIGAELDNQVVTNDDVIDLTLPGAASKPPTYDNHRPAPRRRIEAEVVDYSNGGHDAPLNEIKLDLSPLPASIRRDYTGATRSVAFEMRAKEGEAEMTSWGDLMTQHEQPGSYTVDFSKRPSMEQRGYDHLGRPFPHGSRWS